MTEPRPLEMLPLEMEEFLSWMASERGRSVNTLAAYRRDLTLFSQWLAQAQGRALDQTTEADLREYAVTREQWQAAHAHRVSFRRFDEQDHHHNFPAPAVAAVEARSADECEGLPQVAAQFA